MAITVKNEREIGLMREASEVVALIHERISTAIAPGVTTKDLDDIAGVTFQETGAKSLFLGHLGFKGRICASVNEEIVHGVPGKRSLRDGDIVSVDVGARVGGYCGDSAWTYAVGAISPEAARLLEVTEQSLYLGVEHAVVGAHLHAIGHAVEEYATSQGFGLVREYGGHGIGREMWEDPHVPNHGRPDGGPRLRSGMTLAIEPMLNVGGDETFGPLDDGWTVITADRTLSAHFEHTIVIRDEGPEILTKRVARVVN